jgi:hypothetical protein
MRVLMACCIAAVLLHSARAADPLDLLPPDALPATAKLHDVELSATQHNDRSAVRIAYGTTDWPNLMFRAEGDGGWDWSKYAVLAVTVFNPADEAIEAAMRVDNAGADGLNHCNTVRGTVPARNEHTFLCRLQGGAGADFWGMRGLPGRGPVGTGSQLDLSAIVAFQIFLPRPDKARELLLTDIRLEPVGGPLDPDIPMPFVDAFGQYIHAGWPGKVEAEAELKERRKKETDALADQLSPADRDAFGGWTGGPKLEATGWFRTAWHDGQAWLVTPEGNLFFSTGMDCVGHWERTFVEGRKDWFVWLPPEDDSQFGDIYGQVRNVHSMAEPINGEGQTFSFYTANLIRKYGGRWRDEWREVTYDRLRAWGFNTLGNWCQGDVIAHSPLPYVVSGSISGVPPIEGATGYWAKMKDVYAPEFETRAEEVAKGLAEAHAEKPLCIGYFIDNELAWEGVKEGVLRSPSDQPARQALLTLLQNRYADLPELNAAWETTFGSWDDFAPVPSPNDAMNQDLDAFLEQFARRYFTVIRDALREHAPNQLYLGCRFSTRPETAVRVCADVADVVSFNRYETKVDCDLIESVGETPVIIGEFHFGAMDRGMFHPGLVGVADQKARGNAYARYVESAAACANIVGCHWFQYTDEPITGRTYDGENYNIGFVDVTDTPYPELVGSATKTHRSLYEKRYTER